MKSAARVVAVVLALSALVFAATPDMPKFRWENFTTANGLPNDHVFCVLVDGERIWAGTENGLAKYEDGKWKRIRPSDGLAHRAVLAWHWTSRPATSGPPRWAA